MHADGSLVNMSFNVERTSTRLFHRAVDDCLVRVVWPKVAIPSRAPESHARIRTSSRPHPSLTSSKVAPPSTAEPAEIDALRAKMPIDLNAEQARDIPEIARRDTREIARRDHTRLFTPGEFTLGRT